MKMEHKQISTTLLEPNTGQIPGVPENPRYIRDEKYKTLLNSIQSDPELLQAMPVIVYPLGERFIAIAGNMRLRACQELNHKEIPCVIVPPNTPVETIKAYIIKTNVSYGEHDFDILANNFDFDLLHSYGLDIPDFSALGNIDADLFFQKQEIEETAATKMNIILEYSPEIGEKVREALAKTAATPELAVLVLLGLNK